MALQSDENDDWVVDSHFTDRNCAYETTVRDKDTVSVVLLSRFICSHKSTVSNFDIEVTINKQIAAFNTQIMANSVAHRENVTRMG